MVYQTRTYRRIPLWVRSKYPKNKINSRMAEVLARNHTICESAMCPNRGECYAKGQATFLILGNVCTRGCRFCSVPKGKPNGIDENEIARLAHAVKIMVLRYVVITSVDRDDLSDGGASQFKKAIEAVHDVDPGIKIEILTPDFQGNQESLKIVLSPYLTVFNHNLETAPRFYPTIRPRACYEWSLELLERAKTIAPWVKTKSGIMVGLGETEDEVRKIMHDLKEVHCDYMTIGQYLRPTRRQVPVEEFVQPEVFDRYRTYGARMGITVFAGPLVRSSYMADVVESQPSLNERIDD